MLVELDNLSSKELKKLAKEKEYKEMSVVYKTGILKYDPYSCNLVDTFDDYIFMDLKDKSDFSLRKML